MSYPQISNQNRKEVAIMVSILQQIYAGGLAPICDAMPRVREYQEALQAHFRHYDALREKLTRRCSGSSTASQTSSWTCAPWTWRNSS